jgi:hypothetical protein
MRWVEHVKYSRRGGGDVHTAFVWGAMKARDYLEHLGVCEKIMLRQGSHKRPGTALTGSTVTKIEKHDWLFGNRNATSVAMKCKELTD